MFKLTLITAGWVSVVLAAPGQAPAAVQLQAAVDANPVLWSSESSLDYTLQLTTGPANETLAISVEPPDLPDGGSPLGPKLLDGQQDSLKLDGPGALRPLRSRASLTSGCARPHGYELTRQAVGVDLPANSTSMLTARFALAAFRPWPTANYRVRFRFQQRLPDGQVATSVPAVVSSPQPHVVARPSGVELRLRHPALVRRGRVVHIRGTSSPMLRGVKVVLRLGPPGSTRRLATVRTDRRGRFRYRWRPARRGSYALSAHYRSQRRSTASDYSCPTTVRVV